MAEVEENQEEEGKISYFAPCKKCPAEIWKLCLNLHCGLRYVSFCTYSMFVRSYPCTPPRHCVGGDVERAGTSRTIIKDAPPG